ncbi:glycosyltransferase family 4 protein [Actinomadura rubrisoli]|uniref:Glycosyltransferase family 1 protein n=1 Tax=Actinomadura rubrisoli TaxID=2530368 RepID=A0A4R5AB39_9ACTN|nr:glycosyltransferase family 4 protein [Actinomadura rubrisoli]TDD68034.1 glycosyltransferase family 1 protein [Actinomadura rubrisoli]
MSTTARVAGLRLAVVNWRDPWHPSAGGAERYAWELARGLARRGAHVRYLTSRAPGQRRGERVEGVEFVRMGGRFTVYPLALLWILLRRRSFDAVIDCQNGIPFFTPWALPRRVPVFCVIHHVHDAQFSLYFPAWLARLGQTLEGPVSRWAYRRHAYVVVSPSTLRAVRERLSWTGPAYVVPNGSVPPERSAAPAPGPVGDPELVCVTRLVPHKRLGRLLDLAGRLAERHPGLRLHVVGDGPEAPALADGIAGRGLGGVVIAHGYVPDAVKSALVARADLHLSTSQGEGWGLSVIEAAALGVPTVAPDVDGLRDAVRHGTTGWLACPDEEAADVVERALKELDDPARRAEIAAACRAWAGEFDWARTTGRMAELLAASVRAGSSWTADDRAHVIHRYGDEHPRVLEGPARDELLAAPENICEIRPATPTERLLGRPEQRAVRPER